MVGSGTDQRVALEVFGGPLDGQRYEGTKPLIRLGRSDGAARDGAVNDVVLMRDNYSSGFHMHIYNENGTWFAKDIGSTNGSWKAGAKMVVNEPMELRLGEYLVVGNTVVRFSDEARQGPAIDPLAVNLFSAASQTVANRARNIAKDWQTPWLGSSALFAVISDMDAPPLGDFFSATGLEPDRAREIIKKWVRWRDELAWINKDEMQAKSAQRIKISAPLPTPRLNLIITLADKARERWRAPQIEPIHLLHAIFAEGRNQVAMSLAEAGYAPEVLAQTIADMMETKEAPADSNERERTMAIQVMAPAPSVPKRKPIDVETWITARELMDRIQAAQSEFRLAEPQLRFDALCNLIRDGLQKTQPAKREGLLETLFYLFPLLEEALAPPPAALGAGAAPRKGEETDGRSSEYTPAGNVTVIEGDDDEPERRGDAGFDTNELLQKVFGNERMATMAGQPVEENQILTLMKYLYGFALDMERLAKGMVQSLQGGSAGESRYFLPFTAFDLKMMSEKLLEEGKPENITELRSYLDDLGRWLIALIAAHRKAASEWNKDVWEKISPNSIRNEAKISSINKALGGGAAELWKTYERLSRDLDPDVTDDMINEKVGKIANDEFRRLTSRR